MKVQIARPRDISPERLDKLKGYLFERWRRAESGRKEQVDSKYQEWDKAYRGVPLEQVRTVPFYKSSNFVVKLIRMFIDTFTARTLNIIFATKPLFVVDGLPRELKEAWETYLNNKCLYQWDYYTLTRSIIVRGNKNGSNVTKSPWVEETEKAVSVTPGGSQLVSSFISCSKPKTKCIPFEDFYIYPIVANDFDEAEILFHRIRLSEEEVKRRIDSGIWQLPEGITVDELVKIPRDAKKQSDQTDAGVTDPFYREGTFIECHLKWSFTDDSTDTYRIVTVLNIENNAMIDLYYNPYPRNACIFDDYRPFPREELWWGESMCEILGQSQEEASVIHNDRRNNSLISNSVIFKRRNGSQLPNPSTNWYPGKVFDLDDMADFDVINIGRNYEDMTSQEDYTFNLAQKLSGISDVMQGASQGEMSKRGIYNTMGTMAIMQEGNQRQDTNIRDVRDSLSRVASVASMLQAHYGQDDPFINTLSPEMSDQVRQVFQLLRTGKGDYMRLEIKTSSAGVNKEVERANLMQMAQILGQYGSTVQQMAMQLVNPQLNQGLRMIMNDVVKMQKWMAVRILRQFDEFDAEGIVPDLQTAIEAALKGGSTGTEGPSPGAGPSPMAPGGSPPPSQALTRSGLAAMASLPELPGNAFSPGGMAQ